MANRFYPLGLQHFADAEIDYSGGTQKAALVSSASYTPNFTTDEFFNVIPGGAVIAAGVTLGTKTNVGGALGAANTTWTSVSGTAAAYIILYDNTTGVSSTSPLWGYIDTATGLPVTPNGGDISAAWAGGVIATLFESLSDRERAQVRPGFRSWLEGALRGLWRPNPAGVLVPAGPRILAPSLVIG